jgi:hypothetical protein
VKKTMRFFALPMLAVTVLNGGYSHAQSPTTGGSRQKLAVPSGQNLPVTGAGTPGQLPLWVGLANRPTIGNSIITDDGAGRIGIGTAAPTSTLTAAGTIESLNGGFKFPDGTVQVTAGVSADQVVTSLNGLRRDVTLTAGQNITLAVLGNAITINAAGLLASVAHDGTLVGDGTSASPLKVAIPLALEGSEPSPLVEITNLAEEGGALQVRGGASISESGGEGIHAIGGDSSSVDFLAGNAVIANGGDSTGIDGTGGRGILSFGGEGIAGNGGTGVSAFGGVGQDGDGGNGVFADGGVGLGPGNRGGAGIVALAGGGGQDADDGLAGDFDGDVSISGDLNVTGTKNFKIDHPLDPANKYLVHAAVESSEILNVYSGNAVTDASGEAVVTLPDWFEAVNTDVRYQLTVVGAFAQAIVAEKVTNNRFTIRTDVPSVEVSWLVTGVRSDATSKKQTFKAEQEKAERERGYYLTPEAFDQPAERGMVWARYPKLMKQSKDAREQNKLVRQGGNR